MKRFITTILFIAFFSTYANRVNAQINAFTGTYSYYLNSKLRLQYEGAISKRMSMGGEMTYYLDNWAKGPKFEFFTRLYAYKPSRGFFFQGKIGVGTLTNPIWEDCPDYISNKRFITWGGGIAGGYKVKATKHFIIEGLIGLQLYKGPYAYLKSGVSNNGNIESSKDANLLAWAATTGLPLLVEMKFGYQYKKKHNPPPPPKEEVEEETDSSSDAEAKDGKETKEDKDKKDKKEK